MNERSRNVKLSLLVLLVSMVVLVVLSSGTLPGFNFLPQSTNSQLVSHQYYTLSYSENHEQAEWVAYKLTPEMIRGGISRTDDFRPDPLVFTGSAALIDYKGSGYDRGHLAPAADMKINRKSMSESFYMSNMSPQEPSFNRGIWKKLEEQVRSWALMYDGVYVVTGGVLTDTREAIGPNRVSVPDYYYKVVLDYGNGNEEPKMIGMLLKNRKGDRLLQEYVISVDGLEQLTGIDFFPALPDKLENMLEASRSTTGWDFESVSISGSDLKPGSTGESTMQCLGLAKSTGNRCRNKTTDPSGYCHHHR